MRTLSSHLARFALLAGLGILATGCVTYPDGTVAFLPPPLPVVVGGPVYAYGGGYRYYGGGYYGHPYYGGGYYRPGWNGGYYRGGYYRGGYYRGGYWGGGGYWRR